MNLQKPGYFSWKDDLTDQASRFFDEQGFLVVHDAVAADELADLKAEAAAICRLERGEITEYFAMGEDEKEMSADELRGMADDEVLSRYLCIHHPHRGSSRVKTFLSHPAIVDVLTRVVGPNVKCMQSMLFIKSAGKPGQAWHQDESFIPTRDRSLTGAWIAIDDAVVENGCLWVIPGSHKRGILWPMYPHEDTRYDCTRMAYEFPYADEDAIPVEVPAGAIVFFNGYLLHKSEPNTLEAGFRRTLVNHYMSAESLLPWKAPDTLDVHVGIADHREIVMVAGEDPYAWKGVVETTDLIVRGAGEGGCGDGRSDLETFKKRSRES